MKHKLAGALIVWFVWTVASTCFWASMEDGPLPQRILENFLLGQACAVLFGLLALGFFLLVH